MIDPITPALTAEEWARFLAHGADGQRGMQSIAHREGDLHGCAALCLSGRWFGFTQDDLRVLRMAHTMMGGLIPGEAWIGAGAASVVLTHAQLLDQITTLIDRIAALLPPEGI